MSGSRKDSDISSILGFGQPSPSSQPPSASNTTNTKAPRSINGLSVNGKRMGRPPKDPKPQRSTAASSPADQQNGDGERAVQDKYQYLSNTANPRLWREVMGTDLPTSIDTQGLMTVTAVPKSYIPPSREDTDSSDDEDEDSDSDLSHAHNAAPDDNKRRREESLEDDPVLESSQPETKKARTVDVTTTSPISLTRLAVMRATTQAQRAEPSPPGPRGTNADRASIRGTVSGGGGRGAGEVSMGTPPAGQTASGQGQDDATVAGPSISTRGEGSVRLDQTSESESEVE
ncbi:hypothetical protein Tdes44962_MAKER01206 [Teratosphaeria destructans]|uniref:Uncharacterized protein n=1 Tax=Teratosphaeria destructans TaxID=418781 RepID=A0A9W7T1W6_9PEZI|nr:hypothetical protein Tdes44962_MAKER01206 [Teratosphaeria destructans]